MRIIDADKLKEKPCMQAEELQAAIAAAPTIHDGDKHILYSRNDALTYLLNICNFTCVKEIELIEKILGFELTPQQIHYIASGQWRRSGQTTAEAIRTYLINRNKTILLHPITIREKNEMAYKEKVMQKLSSAGLGNINIEKE